MTSRNASKRAPTADTCPGSTSPSSRPPAVVTIRLRSKPDTSGEYGAFRSVVVEILVNGARAGCIESTLVDRQKIPGGAFMMAMDGADLGPVGDRLYERRRGRPRLRSMAEYDDDESSILFIEDMHVDDEWKVGGNSDVGAEAIRLMLHHRSIRGGKSFEQSGAWSVSSAVYTLNPLEAMTEQEVSEYDRRRESQWQSARHDDGPAPATTEESLRRAREELDRMDGLARSDANQFLRNGFFQDEAVAQGGPDDARILVATYGQWSQPLKSHDDVSSIRLYVTPPMPSPPTGKDSELLNYVRSFSSQAMPHKTQSDLESGHYTAEIRRIVSEGGSLLRSHALHAAVSEDCNNLDLVAFILQTEPLTANALDENGFTPLMHAAISAVMRQNIDGMPETHVIDKLLLAGARRDLTSVSGCTAFGVLVQQMGDMNVTMTADNGWAGTNNVFCRGGGQTPGLKEVALKLMPPGGPTAADLRRKVVPSGMIGYSDEEGSGGSDDDDDDY